MEQPIEFNEAENIFSISGGKDSVCTVLVGREKGIENARYIFADTGNEHEDAIAHIDYLQDALGITIETVKADFSKQIEHKKEVVRDKWVRDGVVTPAEAEDLCKLLVPSGNPFLDLCLWKGRFPSRRAQFCTQMLKSVPIQEEVFRPLINEGKECISWQGIRADESAKRANDPMWEERDSQPVTGEQVYQYYVYRPILHFTAEQTFEMSERHGIKNNPLYTKGMNRVGCMPCINVKKGELRTIAERFPDHIDRIAEWERLVGQVAKRGNSTFFHAAVDPTIATKDNNLITTDSHGVHRIVEWSKTQRGGRYFDWLEEEVQPNVCASSYGLCE